MDNRISTENVRNGMGRPRTLTEAERQQVLSMSMRDNAFFINAMKNVKLFSHMVSLIVGRKFKVRLKTESEIRITRSDAEKYYPSLYGRGVRLDAVGEDEFGNLYDIEMENNPLRASGERCRIYISAIDGNALGKKDDFSELGWTFVIFLFPFRDGGKRSIVTYEMRDEDGNKLGDKTAVIHVNLDYRGNDALGDLISGLSEIDPLKIKDLILRETVVTMKGDDMLVGEIFESKIRFDEEREEALKAEGIKIGKAEQNAFVAKQLLDKGLSIKEISEILCIPESEVSLIL